MLRRSRQRSLVDAILQGIDNKPERHHFVDAPDCDPATDVGRWRLILKPPAAADFVGINARGTGSAASFSALRSRIVRLPAIRSGRCHRVA